MHRRRFISLTGTQLFALAACTVGDDFTKPQKSLPDQYLNSRNSAAAARGFDTWWRAYNDPKLNRLVSIGLQQNLDVQRAVARIEQSQAIVRGAGYPISGAARVSEVRANRGGADGPTESGFVRAEASWQLDLFGQLRREREAAGYRLEAAYADANVARTTLIGELTAAYIDARYFQELIRINSRVVESREKTLVATTQARESSAQSGENTDANGTPVPTVTDLDVAQARTLVATARAELPEVKILFFKSVSRVGTLLGQAWDRPREGLDREAPQPTPTGLNLNTGVPADLLRNRPDIILAENRLAEAVALAGVAEADLYPELQLTGNININYSASDFLPTAGFARLGLDIPLFDLPERRSRVDFQKARAKELQIAWEEEVVMAVEEVQDALVSLQNHREAVEFTGKALEELQEVLRLARKSYVEDRSSFLQVLDAERALLAAENALALDRRNYAVDFVDLNVALGGFYDS